MTTVSLPSWHDSDEEYAAVARVESAGGIAEPRTVETIRSRAEALRSVGFVASHQLAWRGGTTIGFVGFSQLPTAVNDDVFVARIVVVPDERRRGVGSALHETMLEAATRHGIRTVLAYIDERLEGGMTFALSLGYQDRGSYIESSVDPSAVDRTTIAHAIDAVDRAGLRIEPLADLMAQEDAFDRLHELYTTVSVDAPFPIEERPVSEDVLRARFFDSNEAMPRATFVAIDGDIWVGLTELRRVGDTGDRATQDITGVLRGSRRRGIAMALKATSLDYARSVGITRVTAWNDEANTGMRTINERLGFLASHGIRRMTLDLSDHASAGTDAAPHC